MGCGSRGAGALKTHLWRDLRTLHLAVSRALVMRNQGFAFPQERDGTADSRAYPWRQVGCGALHTRGAC